MNRFRPVRLSWLVCALAALIAQPAAAWCELVFQDIAPLAEVVVLAEVRAPKGEQPELVVVEAFKGTCDRKTLNLDPEELVTGIRHGDQVILALTTEHTLVRDNQGLGLCTTINVLHIRDGKLRAQDRQGYDSRRKALPLDQLREELIRDLRPASDNTQLSAR